MAIPASPLAIPREQLFARLGQAQRYDVAIVGGGATGLGVALDAAARGLSVVLLESHDFAQGTSSRSTKLVHGGVRYLAQGNIALVREALHERSTLLHNAPHLAQPLPFVMPSYAWWQTPFYGLGLKLYDALAGASGLGPTEFLSRAQTQALLPNIQMRGLKGGVKYWDGQFDDARLAIALARTAAQRGALLINYCAVSGLLHEAGKVVGLSCTDGETGRDYQVRSGCVINATGVWVDALRQHDGEVAGRPVPALVAPSQGVHLVVDRSFMPGEHALLVPHTADGRVLFAVPWLGKLVLGTTDTPRDDMPREPAPFAQEVDFILNESARYLDKPPTRADVTSAWVGLRPLVKEQGEDPHNTKGLSREHTVVVSRSGLVTVTGGKWTTYRAMAEDVLTRCALAGLLEHRQAATTQHLRLIGAGDAAAIRPDADVRPPWGTSVSAPPGLHSYGAEAAAVLALPGAEHALCPGLTEAMVRFAARCEYARTVEDVLVRRSRLLFLDARLAASVAQQTADILQTETGQDPHTAAFLGLAQDYLRLPE